jgi:hypothetical protein
MTRPRFERENVRDTVSNRLALLVVFLETWHLCALSFGEGIPYDTAGYVQSLTTSNDPSTHTRWSLNGVMLLALLDFRLLGAHTTDLFIGLILLSLLPPLWLISRRISRSQVLSFATTGMARIEGGKGGWARREWLLLVLSQVLATLFRKSPLYTDGVCSEYTRALIFENLCCRCWPQR